MHNPLRTALRARALPLVLFATVLSATCSPAQSPKTAEDRTVAAFVSASANPLEQRVFLEAMPKGGDLHFHLTGAVYAETILRDAAEDGLCVDPVAHTLVPNKGLTGAAPARPVCEKGTLAAADLPLDAKAYDGMIDAWSMRSFMPSAGVSGHDHFFTSGLRGGTDRRHLGEWLDEVASRAAAQNEQYLEIQTNMPYPNTLKAAADLHWQADMAPLRQALLAKGLRDDVTSGRADLDRMEATRNALEHCGTPQATPACSVLIRYLYVVSRGNLPERVFAQSVLALELASADRRIVGVDFAQPEDSFLSMTEYHRQMEMLQYLHGVYPNVPISLHAGELSFGLVPPEGLRFHIREAVEIAGARRIGHGVDVMYETDPYGLLKEMAAKHVMVEINLTSNDLILGVTGKQHPLPLYLAAGVPIALSTDDEGVSRIDLTHEYVRAAQEFGLGYRDLKRSARTSIEHSFLPGEDLWANTDDFTRKFAACAELGSPSCQALRRRSLKADQELQLEARFAAFEATFP